MPQRLLFMLLVILVVLIWALLIAAEPGQTQWSVPDRHIGRWGHESDKESCLFRAVSSIVRQHPAVLLSAEEQLHQS